MASGAPRSHLRRDDGVWSYAIDAMSTQVYKQTIEDAICELHDKVRSNQIQIIDGTYSTRALRLLLSK